MVRSEEMLEFFTPTLKEASYVIVYYTGKNRIPDHKVRARGRWPAHRTPRVACLRERVSSAAVSAALQSEGSGRVDVPTQVSLLRTQAHIIMTQGRPEIETLIPTIIRQYSKKARDGSCTAEKVRRKSGLPSRPAGVGAGGRGDVSEKKRQRFTVAFVQAKLASSTGARTSFHPEGEEAAREEGDEHIEYKSWCALYCGGSHKIKNQLRDSAKKSAIGWESELFDW
jgi:hypothetical protein